MTRDCLKCGKSYYDDGNSWCPPCDAAQDFGPGVLPDARERVLAMRMKEQERLKELSHGA